MIFTALNDPCRSRVPLGVAPPQLKNQSLVYNSSGGVTLAIIDGAAEEKAVR